MTEKFKSFRDFFNEENGKEESKDRQNEIKEAGYNILRSRIVALFNNIAQDIIECKTFTYKKVDDKVGTCKLTIKCGTKNCHFELDEDHNMSFKHSLKGTLNIDEKDPDFMIQLSILTNLYNRKSYLEGIKNAMITLAHNLIEDKERTKNND